ncbi:MAG: hemolysin family protein [Gemmatimonadota bacterium]|nr:hemolysin family protein [Gemmatimonadota bacterium]MDH3424094.1 hemolysin family protein [Gemmatimonadota bacterium]
MMWAAGVAGVVLVVCAAMLTAAQAATSQMGASRVRTLLEEGFTGAAALSEVREREARVRASVRLVTQSFNLAALGITAIIASVTWDAPGPVVAVVVGTIAAVLVIGDIIPHAVAARSPVRIALASASTLLGVTRWTRLLTAPAAHLEERMVGGSDETLSTERRELLEIQEIGEEEGILEEAENLLVERAFHLDELTAWDVMVPRVDIFAWKDDLTLDAIVGGLPEVPYSRVPVYSDSVDDVTGIVYIREVYERVAGGNRTAMLRDLAREPFFVPGSLSLTQLLHDFQARRIHMGIVADEFGGTDGLVTLEDILEELVGEIHDETDVESEGIVHVSPVALEAGAGTDLRDLNEALEVSLPKAEHRSLNGFILEELGHVPKQGASFERAGVQIEILEATDTQVLKARLTKLADVEEATD